MTEERSAKQWLAMIIAHNRRSEYAGKYFQIPTLHLAKIIDQEEKAASK